MSVAKAATLKKKTTSASAIKFGDIVTLKNAYAGGQYMSPCGSFAASCGTNISLRTDEAFLRHEPNSNLRNFKITGGPEGEALNGRRFQIEALATGWAGHSGIIAPCGGSGCSAHNGSVGVSVRIDMASFANTELGWWEFHRVNGAKLSKVESGDEVNIYSRATMWDGHSGYLASCGQTLQPADCGIDVNIRRQDFPRDNEVYKWTVELLEDDEDDEAAANNNDEDDSNNKNDDNDDKKKPGAASKPPTKTNKEEADKKKPDDKKSAANNDEKGAKNDDENDANPDDQKQSSPMMLWIIIGVVVIAALVFFATRKPADNARGGGGARYSPSLASSFLAPPQL